jgi:hypothetical protein
MAGRSRSRRAGSRRSGAHRRYERSCAGARQRTRRGEHRCGGARPGISWTQETEYAGAQRASAGVRKGVVAWTHAGRPGGELKVESLPRRRRRRRWERPGRGVRARPNAEAGHAQAELAARLWQRHARGSPAARAHVGPSGHRAPGRGVQCRGRSRAPRGEVQGSCRGVGCRCGPPETCRRGAGVHAGRSCRDTIIGRHGEEEEERGDAAMVPCVLAEM